VRADRCSHRPIARRTEVEAFHEALRRLGYIEGRNIAFEWRSSGGRAERFPTSPPSWFISS